MGSGFKIIQNATLTATYRQSIFANSLTEPICELNVNFGENVAIAYGPWAEACRIAFFSYFFPVDFTDGTLTEVPKNAERKIPLRMDITLTMTARTTINLWFMRHDELNTIAVIIKNGFSIRMENPLIIAKEEYKKTIRFNMKNVQFLPTSGFRKLISYDELTVEFNMQIPKQYGDIEKCEISMKMNGATMWFVWDHVNFIQDFISEMSTYYTEDLAQFVPRIWECRIELNNLKFIFVTNDKNWIDASNPLNNFLIALIAKCFTISCNLNKTDFCPQICHCKCKMIANEAVAIKFHIPQRSTLSPVIHTLYDNSYHISNNSTIQMPVFAEIDSSWLDFLRTQQITFTSDYTWHPIYLPYQSDLPVSITNAITAQQPAHPFELEPDFAQIDIVIQSPELFISGFAVWAVKNFMNDYFGLFSQQLEMDSYQAHTLLSRRLYGDKIKHEAEYYRPLNMNLSVRVQEAYGHCLTHSIKTTGKKPDPCPIMKANTVMMEISQKIRDLQYQMLVAGFQIIFQKSESFKEVQNGLLSIDQIAIRMDSFSSELNIPWNAGSVQYASALEIIIGEMISKIDPTQVKKIY
uniref:Bridge-like lipid transfer protein family member 1 N-terminal domain-containing protein n=1 Tax=Setaria digitata TaxID=48799 RepID=A0A915PW87_9BILA